MGNAADIENIVAANVKARREAAGLSQASLAELANMSTTTVYRLEAAERWPRPENVRALAQALKCSESELFSSGKESGVPPKLLELIASAAREAGLSVVRRDVIVDPAMGSGNFLQAALENVKVAMAEEFERRKSRAIAPEFLDQVIDLAKVAGLKVTRVKKS